MALINKLAAIGDAIRSKTGGSSALTLPQMASAVSALVVPNDTLTYGQMNTQAAAYIANVTYDPSDYSYSDLSTYVIATDYEKSKPFGAEVTLPSAGTLTIQDGAKSMSYAASSGSNTIYNITPGSTGTYYLKNSSDAIVAAGLLKPTGSLRMINASATYNIRDLGGWACDGGTVKYGMIFRGGAIAAADVSLFHDLLGIRAEVDLRWDSEASPYYSAIGGDVGYLHVNGPWYTIGENSNWPADAHKQILEFVMDKAIAGVPLYFHCSAGADRTGTIAFLLEAMLGMSQSDTDKEYELTSFRTGIETDAQARRRDEDAWKNYMAQFNSFTGSIMRDKVVNWALTIGITIEKINAFRAAMIDGNPSTLTGDVGTVTVTRSLTGASVDNTMNTNAMYQPYKAAITPDANKVITAVQITMGGTDITDEVFSGSETVFRHSVTFNLTNCSLSTLPQRKSVVTGECFCCALEADAGYSLNDNDDPTVTITMGGINMSTYYKDGVISIPRVTGNLVISVSAAVSTPNYTNQISQSTTEIGGSVIFNSTGYKNGYRYNSSMGESGDGTGNYFMTGYIHMQQGDVVRFYGNIFNGVGTSTNCAFYKTDGTKLRQFTPAMINYFVNGTSDADIGTYIENVDYDTTNEVLHSFKWKPSYDGWVKFTCIGQFTAGTTVITINEEM